MESDASAPAYYVDSYETSAVNGVDYETEEGSNSLSIAKFTLVGLLSSLILCW